MTNNKGMNQLDRPWANFDVSMVKELISDCFQQGYEGVKVSYIDSSPAGLAHALGVRMRKADDEIEKLKGAHD